MMNGGYLMVSKTDTKLYEKLNKALTLGKPVLWYEDENTCYYIDTITKSGTDIILTKGGKTITIENDGDVTEVGDIQNPILETIKDKNGNLRFIEGDLTFNEITGITFSYGKYSLSGTHLMIVLIGEVDANTTLSDGVSLGSMIIPKWINDKIMTYNANFIELKNLIVKTTGYSEDVIGLMTLAKGLDDILYILNNSGSHAITNAGVFRLQFDLIIDNE